MTIGCRASASTFVLFAVLRALKEAAEDELIVANPMATPGKSIRRLLAPQPQKVKAMTAEQPDRFLSTTKRIAKLYPLYLAGARAGLRIGELCGWQLDKWVQQQLGHASSRITLDVYADWFALQDHADADAIGAKVLGDMPGNTRHAVS